MTREHWENLKVGDHIVVSDVREDPVTVAELFPMFGGGSVRRKQQLDLRPYRIILVELPFIIVTDGHHRGALDLRVLYVKKVSKKYARLFEEQFEEGSNIDITGRSKRKSGLVLRKKKKEKPDPNACPRCGLRMTQIKRPKKEGWFFHCPNCDMDFNRADQ